MTAPVPRGSWWARLVCRLRGHDWIRHITEVRMPKSAPLDGTFGVQVEPLDWYYACSRCRRTMSRDEVEEPSGTSHRPVWASFRVRR